MSYDLKEIDRNTLKRFAANLRAVIGKGWGDKMLAIAGEAEPDMDYTPPTTPTLDSRLKRVVWPRTEYTNAKVAFSRLAVDTGKKGVDTVLAPDNSTLKQILQRITGSLGGFKTAGFFGNWTSWIMPIGIGLYLLWEKNTKAGRRYKRRSSRRKR